jgi:pimeloyl-ACP methyl ester carboxylesterase
MNGVLSYIRSQETGDESQESGDRSQETGDRSQEPVLLFHGYGQDASVFKDFPGYSFDLFFHGKSVWHKGEEPLEKAEWKEMISEFLDNNHIKTFRVLGFSMGAKFALATLEAFPDRVTEIILLAPDGIKTSFWYSLATYPVALRRFFKGMISNHSRFFRIATIAKKLGLIDKGVLRFVETQMDSEEKRKRVYYSWVVFRHLKFDLDAIAGLIDKNKIKLRLFVGRHDKIITATNMHAFISKVPGAEFEVLDAGHNNLTKAYYQRPKSS